jgi:hypothetical protein
MRAQPVHEPDPDDPVEILRVLRLWHLTAVAHSDPGFAGRLAAMREAVQSGSLEGSTPIEDAVPGWSGGL